LAIAEGISMPTTEITEAAGNGSMTQTTTLAPKKEIAAWVLYHIAYSGVPAVVSTAVFNAYFVDVVCHGLGQGTATLLWTIAVSIANGLVMASAPILGTIADHSASKKRILAFATVGCIITTGLLALAQPGTIPLAIVLTVLSGFMFSTAEDMIAAFLPELCPVSDMGRISAFGASGGHFGSLLALALCLGYVTYAQHQGQQAAQFVPVTMIIVAVFYAVLCLPTFLFLKERAVANALEPGQTYWSIGIDRLKVTFKHATRFVDLFRLLLSIVIYTCGTATVVVLAAVYAHQVMGFTMSDTITMILVVQITAMLGAVGFGFVQDKIGSKRTLAITLVLWIMAITLVYFTDSRPVFWLAANLMGTAIGSSYSVGRAMVGQFSPTARAGEFFGLWGLACKLAAIIGPLSYGLITFATGGNQRMAILSTVLFFVGGLIVLATVNERRGKEAALIGE
jgi:UMF1 family MFS transporter